MGKRPFPQPLSCKNLSSLFLLKEIKRTILGIKVNEISMFRILMWERKIFR